MNLKGIGGDRSTVSGVEGLLTSQAQPLGWGIVTALDDQVVLPISVQTIESVTRLNDPTTYTVVLKGGDRLFYLGESLSERTRQMLDEIDERCRNEPSQTQS